MPSKFNGEQFSIEARAPGRLPSQYADFNAIRIARLREDMHLSDGEINQLRLDLDDEFFCRIPPTEWSQVRTWGDVIDLVRRVSVAGEK